MKYLKVADQLRRQVRSGVLKPGERLPSLSNMRQQGISQNTMERVHMLLEQEGLIVRRHRSGVFVAQTPIQKATGIIGVLGTAFLQSPEVPYWSHLLSGLRAAAHRNGREVLLLGSSTPGLGWEKIDGVLVCGEKESEHPRLPPGMPGVSLVYGSRTMPSIVANDFSGAKVLTEHLLQLGHRRIANLTMLLSPADMPSKMRQDGCKAALWEYGIEPDSRWSRELMYRSERNVEQTASFNDLAYDKVRRWLREDWRELGCTALLTQNDESAIGAIAAFRDAGVALPEEVSVAGFDGTKVGEYCTPRLTTVRVPLQEIGEKGVELLLRCIADEEVEAKTSVIPTQLIVRESTAPALGKT